MRRDPRPTAAKSDAATLTALMALMLAALGLLALIATVWPAAIGIVLVVGAVFFFASFHYLVWGWWLVRLKRDEDEWPE